VVRTIIAHIVERFYMQQRPRKVHLNESHAATYIPVFHGISY